ncbi:MAG TPA: hypothetical protein VGG14_16610 [Candidatus Sulfotelmatobacter sp.]
MTDNRTIGLLRAIGADESAPASKRLIAIDTLASLTNCYQTKKIHTDVYVETTERARQSVIKLLRRLLKSKGYLHEQHPMAIRSRLLFISGVETGKHLYRLKPIEGEVASPIGKPVARVPNVVSDIEQFLREHGG